ncbi:hypothetical protein NQ176_g3481 [Zarea fungicola]|uniref:Uncharacterized protein n=1 Tax=Zarea fungicola TaxID=93591 RepID=A0ACC1NJD8_9HYPO|nr:hypothetical protein NQ176_g3481 [Lecanicillium fungicola]
MFYATDGSFWPESFPFFDFSLTFEETILQILPSGSFILFASALVLYYRQRPVCIRHSALLWVKLAGAALLILLELANVLLRCLSPYRTDTTYPAASIDLIAALAIGTVIYIEHRHAFRTSALLGLYLAVGILIDGTKSRSFFKRDLVSSGSAAAATAMTRLILLILEEIPKKNLLIDSEIRRVSAGEATSGVFTRTFFLFLHPLMRTGFHGILAMRDLDSLGIEFSSRYLFSKLSACWPTSKRSTKHSLFIACCIAWKGAILVILIPRLCVTGFIFAQPFVMRSIILTVKEPNTANDERGGLLGAIVLTFGGAAVCRAISTHMQNRLVTRLRGGLLSQLFDKSHRLKMSDAKKQAAITLISADFDGIASGFPQYIEIPFSVLESGLGMYFLSRLIQQSCLVLFLPLLVSTMAGILYGKHLTPAMKYWNEHIETRVAKTSRTLSQLPAIKKLGLGPKIAEFIQHLRVVETAASRRYRRIQALSLGSAVIVDMMTPVAVIAAGLFSLAFGEDMSAEAIYPTLGIVALVQGPLSELLKLYPSAMSMLGCFERVQEFLCQDENSDPRLLESCGSTLSQSSRALHDSVFMRFVDASIAPCGAKEPFLKNVTFSIAEGSTIAMFGGTSSGKTTLLQSMLGEAEILHGYVYIDESNSSIALCGQITWLPNVTVRDCIVGACEYDCVWFNTVVNCCQLVEDFKQLPDGENYVIGSDGAKLSGGQRQRIGIARSVYARTKAVIFDDAFSALDETTAINVLFGPVWRGRASATGQLHSSHFQLSVTVPRGC